MPRILTIACIALLGGGLAAQEFRKITDIAYAERPGSRPRLTSLDLYLQPGAQERPVVIWIHGGAWSLGDKRRVGEKARAFTERGFLLASINYRLHPQADFRAQGADVARAIRWVRDNIARRGGAPDKIFLMGHSAGAHLAALVACDPRYLAAEQLELSAICGVILLDGAGYDIPRQVSATGGPTARKLYTRIFTEDPATQREASPLAHVAKDRGIAPFLILYVPTRASARQQSTALARKLERSSVTARLHAAAGKTHATINRELGTPGDEPTHAVFAFLAECLGEKIALPAGRAEEHHLDVQGRERSYLLYLPRSARGAVPLLLALHGGGGNPIQMQKMSRFDELAEREGFAVAYPAGLGGHWNDGRDVSGMLEKRELVDDLAFLRALVDELAREGRIDRARVFATGISNGAFMSHRLAAEAADLVLAIAPVVGGMAPAIAERFSPSHPVSMILIQGDADPLVPIEGGPIGRSIGLRRGETAPMSAIVKKYLEHLGISAEPASEILPDADPRDGTRVERRRYPAAGNRARVHVYVVKNGGHIWPGRPPYATERLIGKACRDVDASELIWRFFASCPRRQRDL